VAVGRGMSAKLQIGGNEKLGNCEECKVTTPSLYEEVLQNSSDVFRKSAGWTGVSNASRVYHNKAEWRRTFFSGFPVTAPSAFLATPLAYRSCQ
jgi:hypothetical protein